LSGGLRYRPMTSAAFSSNSGSVLPCSGAVDAGWIPARAHTRATRLCETPKCPASFRSPAW
jgi:hypothetical protein